MMRRGMEMAAVVVAAAVLLWSSFGALSAEQRATGSEHWVATWGTAQTLARIGGAAAGLDAHGIEDFGLGVYRHRTKE